MPTDRRPFTACERCDPERGKRCGKQRFRPRCAYPMRAPYLVAAQTEGPVTPFTQQMGAVAERRAKRALEKLLRSPSGKERGE